MAQDALSSGPVARMSQQALEAAKEPIELAQGMGRPGFEPSLWAGHLNDQFTRRCLLVQGRYQRRHMSAGLRRNCHDSTRFNAHFRRTTPPSQTCPPRPEKMHKKTQKRRIIPTETEMKSTKMAPSTPSIRREAQNLEVRYGKIGISAV